MQNYKVGDKVEILSKKDMIRINGETEDGHPDTYEGWASWGGMDHLYGEVATIKCILLNSIQLDFENNLQDKRFAWAFSPDMFKQKLDRIYGINKKKTKGSI